MTFADRVTSLMPEGAYAVLARAQALEAQGRDIIHLEIGQPDFDTFPHISLRGVQAIASGHTRYNPPAGLPDLRRVIATDAGRRRGMEIQPERVVVGPGAKPGLFFPTLALVEPGDEVLYPDPGFPTYPAMIEVAGGVPVPVPLRESENFSFDLDAFDGLVNQRTKLIVLNSPANPTGGVIPRKDLEHVAGTANAWLVGPPMPGMSRDASEAPLDFRIRQAISRHRQEIERLERQLRELEVEANLAAVPEDWRR